MYARFVKRLLDLCAALVLLAALSPVLLVLVVVGAVAMRGNPFFVQRRPGRNERIFPLIKFRTMTRAVDADGQLLPDAQRLTRYGRFLRATSLDELGELFNIVAGHMSFVGPRPLLVEYLPLYNEEQRHRHDVRPGLTGLAQVSGRNAVGWEERFRLDVAYAQNVTFEADCRILLKTVGVVLGRRGIHSATSATMEVFTGSPEPAAVDAAAAAAVPAASPREEVTAS